MLYEEIKHLEVGKQAELITEKLVKIPSINGTLGEYMKAEQIKQWISSFPYFKKNPHLVWDQPIPGDSANRRNVFALVKGEQGSNRTVIYHGHLDTVGVKDFGNLEEHASDPEKLKSYFQTFEGDSDVRKAAMSSDWMFGRGSLDMQSGDAVHLVNLLYQSEHAKQLNGNVLVMFNPDEEAEHRGIIHAIEELTRLKNEHALNYVCAVNTDFISPLYEGDTTKYLYTGAAGKLLPSFYIYGREAHVGETLSGIDSTLIASEINRKINNNFDLAEPIDGEVVNPPSCLFQRDFKDAYNVQTPFKSFMYFNYFLYEDNPKAVLDKIKQCTVEACAAVETYLRRQYKKAMVVSGRPVSEATSQIKVRTLSEYIEELSGKGIDAEAIIAHTQKQHEEAELRNLAYLTVDALKKSDPDNQPTVIIYFSPPHCPHHYLRPDQHADAEVLKAIEQTMNQTDSKETFAIKRFFPFLSDSSYLSLHETDEELKAMIENFTPWGERYDIPVKAIRSLSIPAVNFGVYGKDAHQWTERVYKPYSFETVPILIRQLTNLLLNVGVLTF